MHSFEDELPIPEDLITINQYLVCCLLSDESAGQSKVFLVQKQGQRFAIKVHEKLKHFKEQVGFLQKIDSLYVVKMLGYSESAELIRKNGEKQIWPIIVLHFMERGDLSQYWRLAKRFSPSTCKTLFKSMLLGIKHIHEKGITHRDIKLQNFLFDRNYGVKIIDFGFSTLSEGLDGSKILREGKGTYIYWAPEVHKKMHIGIDRDVFAVVIILFLLYTGYPPFTNTLPQNEKYRLLKDGNPNDCEKYWEKISKSVKNIPSELKDLFEKSFNEDPTKRLTIEELLNHPWVINQPANPEQIESQLSKTYEKMKVKDDRVKEIERVKKQYQQQIITEDEKQYHCVRSTATDASRPIDRFVKKYKEFEEMEIKVSNLRKRNGYLRDPQFEEGFSPAFVLAWVFKVFEWVISSRLYDENFYNVKIEESYFEYEKQDKIVYLSIFYEIDDLLESVKIKGRLYQSMEGPPKWGISWHFLEGNQFWAEQTVTILCHELWGLNASSSHKTPPL